MLDHAFDLVTSRREFLSKLLCVQFSKSRLFKHTLRINES